MTTLVDPTWGWLLAGAPALLTLLALLVVALVGRGQLVAAAQQLIARRMRRRGQGAAPGPKDDPAGALRWTPPIIAPQTLVAIACFGTALVIVGLGLGGLGILRAMVASIPLVTLVVYVTLVVAELRYVRQLEQTLTAAVGRLGMAIANNTAFVPALDALLADLALGPLRTEWTYLRQTIGRAQGDGTIAGPRQVVGALAVQTPSRRHATVLRGIEVALGQTQAVLAKRLEAEYARLLRSDMRRSAADAELTQVRLTGFVMTFAIVAITAYMYWTMPDRMGRAYGSALGVVAAPLLLLCALAPSIGGIWLSRIDDLE